MHTHSGSLFVGMTVFALCAGVMIATGAHPPQQQKQGAVPKEKRKASAPESLPKVPPPDAKAAEVPSGFRVDVVLTGLSYPTSIEFDEAGTMYVAEGGYIYGDDVAPARVLRISPKGSTESVADDLNGPITDLLWHGNRLFISHRGKISVLESDGVRDLVTGLPSLGDHHNNQLTVGPDGKIYFGQGTVTNSGVVGLDSFKMGWLAKYPDVRDIPAKDIRLNRQPFETPDPFTLIADTRDKHDPQAKDHAGHGESSKGHHAGHGEEAQGARKTRQGSDHGEHKKADESPMKGHSGHPPKEGEDSKTPKEHEPVTGAPKGEGQAHKGHELKSKNVEKQASHGEHGAGKPATSGHERQSTGKTPQGSHDSDHKTTDASPMKPHSGHPPKESDSDSSTNHEGHTTKKTPQNSKTRREHEHAAGAPTDEGQAHEGHDLKSKNVEKQESHGEHPTAEPATSGHDGSTTKTFAFRPFGKTPPDEGAVPGSVKANGTILRMNPDGSDLEVYAWGLRNPFGVAWSPDGKLYASDNGYDERGSRPIAHAPDCLWVIKQDAWYGFPDYAGGVPVTGAEFQPAHGPPTKFLMRDHPPVEKPLLTLSHHVGAAKLDFAPGKSFGFAGQVFLALSGDMNPITGVHEERSGFEVVRVDPKTAKAETFFKAKKSALGAKGMEYVATPGPRRPVDVRFSRDGKTLYVVDVGAMAIVSTAAGPAPRPFPGTGVVWRISREEQTAARVPANTQREVRK